MKLTDKIASRDKSRPYYTFEFFPPRTDQGFQNLLPRVLRLSKLDPLAVSITWGAGGSTKDRSLDLTEVTQKEYGLDTILHLTCTNMMQGMVDMALNNAKDRGIQNILALRGDPPRGKEEWMPIDPKFQHGVDLVSYIRSRPEFSSHFCIGVAAYPEGHPESNTLADDALQHLKAKVDAGADFIITQLFYDVDNFISWVTKVRDMGISIPIIPGIMPMQTYASFMRVTKLCGVHVPPSILADLQPIQNDDQLVKEYGVKLAIDMIQKLVSSGAVSGVHFCTLNLEKSVQRVLEGLQWTGVHRPSHNLLITATNDEIQPGSSPGADLVINSTAAADVAKRGLADIPKTQGEVGSGELNNAASWDEFPNGRFGDFKSPAFGDQGLWGSIDVVRSDALSLWGHPRSVQDLTKIFLDYLQSKIPVIPFSTTPLSPETLTILSHLERLTSQGWWTVGSQPAVNAARSDDPVMGWGPRGGFVFQKGFVEFFCPEEEVDKIESKIIKKGNGWVHWFAGNNKGDCRTNVPDDGKNAVTWGVFPGQEIIQTTIIERESFLSWKEEAFSIWSQWASYYRPGTPEREVLEGVKRDRWLVSIVHHDYQNPDALWEFIFDQDD